VKWGPVAPIRSRLRRSRTGTVTRRGPTATDGDMTKDAFRCQSGSGDDNGAARSPCRRWRLHPLPPVVTTGRRDRRPVPTFCYHYYYYSLSFSS